MKIAVVGYGYWGPNVVRSLCELTGPENVVVHDACKENAARARSEHRGIGIADGWRDLLKDEQVEAVCLCTPAGTHYKMACEALAAGKHLLVEKPFTTSSREAAALFEKARQRGLVLMAGHVFLYAPALRALKALIDRGELGELRYMHSRRTSLGPRAREDVSVVWDYLVHDVYAMPHLAGAQPEEVSAYGEAYLRPGVADVVFATMRFPGKLIASCHASWYDPLKVRHMCVVGSRRMAVYDDADPITPLVLYERGYEPVDGMDSFGNRGLRRYDDGSRVIAVDNEQPLIAECRAFLEAVASGRAPVHEEVAVTGTVAALEAVDRSLKNGGRCVAVERAALKV